jgi:hypothetical protein
VGVEDNKQGNTSDHHSRTRNELTGGVQGTVFQAGRVDNIHVTAPAPEKTSEPARSRKVLRWAGWTAAVAVLPVAVGLILVTQLPRESHVAIASSLSATATVSTPSGSSSTPAPVAPPKTDGTARSSQPGSTTTVPAETSKPSTRYGEPPNLTGNWLLHFHESNFGDNGTHDYTIALHRLDDAKCGGTPPCYGGIWYSVEAKAMQGGNLVAKSSISTDGGKLIFTATDSDEHGTQTYNGTAPNDTAAQLSYSGDWSETNGWAGTFSFIRQA